VFTSTIGTPLDDRNVRWAFKQLLTAAKLPKIRIHDLRHMCATLLLAQDVHPKVVQEILGHSQISLTLDTYSDVLPHIGREAAQQMNALLRARKRLAVRLAVNLNNSRRPPRKIAAFVGEKSEPEFHQLEPDGELAEPAPGAPRNRIVKPAGAYESLAAEWG
jgi:hypothetical protein